MKFVFCSCLCSTVVAQLSLILEIEGLNPAKGSKKERAVKITLQNLSFVPATVAQW
jgi:hypothetical protein